MTRSSPLFCVVGARPNFMKMAAILPALTAAPDPMPVRLIHTGQHYDAAMKAAFFTQLEIPEPDADLEVGSGSHAVQTAEIMKRFEPLMDRDRPRGVLVVGDVNSTIACALTAAKKGVAVIHVEAGLRSFDRTMPEEINRLLTDQLSDYLFTTERAAGDQLRREGIAAEKIHFAGNVMIDTLHRILPQTSPPAEALRRLRVEPPFAVESKGYALLTLHRPANVDDPEILTRLLDRLSRLAARLPILFPIHPRTGGRIRAAGLAGRLEAPGMLALPPVGYVEMLGLMAGARLVMTDSGGVQEETTALGVPCLTLRDNTERPITVSQGTNTIVGSDPDRIEAAFAEILASGGKTGRTPELWDGRAAQRIAAVLKERLGRPGGG